MPLSETRLKNKLRIAFTEAGELSNADAATERICIALAKAIVEEIKEAKINYSTGLTAPNGPVAGTFNHTIT